MTEEIIDNEEQLIFQRFPADKQEQVRALVNYATLMGLNGKDLVSIGGKLDRIDTKREVENNRRIVESMNIRTVGKDKTARDRWSYVHNGVRYTFEHPSYYEIRIRSGATNRVRYEQVLHDYKLGRWRYMDSFYLPTVMLNVYHGHIKLGF